LNRGEGEKKNATHRAIRFGAEGKRGSTLVTPKYQLSIEDRRSLFSLTARKKEEEKIGSVSRQSGRGDAHINGRKEKGSR